MPAALANVNFAFDEGKRVFGIMVFSFNNDKRKGKAISLWGLCVDDDSPKLYHDHRIKIDKYST